jgi:hypothetical protein
MLLIPAETVEIHEDKERILPKVRNEDKDE